jgi:hypothetical protein
VSKKNVLHMVHTLFENFQNAPIDTIFAQNILLAMRNTIFFGDFKAKFIKIARLTGTNAADISRTDGKKMVPNLFLERGLRV